jgi:hypothetical protein
LSAIAELSGTIINIEFVTEFAIADHNPNPIFKPQKDIGVGWDYQCFEELAIGFNELFN